MGTAPIKCPVCGYDVRAIGSLRCPECGTDLGEYAPPRPTRRNPLLMLAGTAFLIVLSFVVIMVSPAARAALDDHEHASMLLLMLSVVLALLHWLSWIWLFAVGCRPSIWNCVVAAVLGTGCMLLTLCLFIGASMVFERWVMYWP